MATSDVLGSTAGGAATGATIGGPWGAVIGGGLGLMGGLMADSEETAANNARSAASAFSFNPPIGSTLPRKVISPVMAISCRTFLPDNAEYNDVAMVTPADGPSFGIAPAGT